MEMIQSHKTRYPLPSVLFLLHMLSLHLPSLAYTVPDKYFISCGSDTNSTASGRTFIGDLTSGNSGSFTFTRQSSPVKDSNKSTATPPLYQTARIFRERSSYEFVISSAGTYLVRLHFFSFSYSANLSTALFDVLASEISLVGNFSVPHGSNSPLIKEFFINITVGKFPIYFMPQGSSFAFVNAIELFLAPENFIPSSAELVSPAGSEGNYEDILSKALLTIHRINVGGPTLLPENDTLWRYWVPDDSFLYSPDTAKNISSLSSKPDSQGGVSEYIAPDLVYQTAKEMNINSNSDDSGIMRISIGPRQDSGNHTAFLNGLEIMEIMGELGKLARTSDPKKKNTSVFVVVGSVLGGLVLICILAVVLCLGRRCRKPKAMETLDWSPVPVHRGGSTDSRLQVPEGAMFGSMTPNLNLGLRISFAEIQFATNKFDIKKKIGKGGFGTVFRGTLSNGTEVAVKRSEPGSHQGLPEFQTEIIVLSKIRHRHLVSLIGYCDENSEMILVYEFMEKGTLRDHLYDSALPSLPWKQRLGICIGAANGLHYLHRGSSGGFIHRDVKSTNVLLDENYVAKVADFGLSRLSGPPDQTHVSTVVKGTFGYLDPDYFKTQQLTEKSDVYSFGVVLLEVLCARPAINTLLPLEQVNLAEWAMFCKKKGMLEQIVDPSIRSEINLNCLRKFVDTAERCLEEYGVDRPNMGDVVWDLEYALQLQQTAMPRELHEDSTTDASAMLALPNIQHLPSLSMSMERDDMPMLREDLSNSPAIEVFSQLRIDDAR
ncbi:probable receptor-like protein kinase At5g24010 isoform X2 [Populus nigra]|uniref:probable receptor-like protein kinase At5g24010 isoform X2 n=1 Tax=Populus nigra TaxID=3691 RepID=UPI002B267BD9|nr:probable receptor-like protein kinase At5g24010 isoform X2 [Populus nigra]